MSKIGFTGTQQGMTDVQKAIVETILIRRPYKDRAWEAHHGLCVGADTDFHEITRKLNQGQTNRIRLIGHPPENQSKMVMQPDFDELRDPKPYLERNHDIVDETIMLVACPKGQTEELRSGTWATIRYAKKLGRPVIIVYASGVTVRS